MSRHLLGCAGWGYDDWRGGFYPPGTPPSEYLERYARVFRLAEVDSSFYAAPTREQTARWAQATPAGFTFALKFPSAVTHDARLRGKADSRADAFLEALAPLRAAGKLGPVVLQFPFTFTRDRDEGALHAFLADLPRDLTLAVELRHPSWWTSATYRALEARGAALVWSVTEHGRSPAVATAPFVYLRLVGDWTLTRFDRVQRDATDEMRHWARRLQDEGRSAERVYGILNNHLQGFAPASAGLFARLLGADPLDLSAALRPPGQRSLLE